MFMYPVVTTNISLNNTNNTNMPRNRSLSASSNQTPPLISRGFASLRRAHRRLSNSSPSSPIMSPASDTMPVPPLPINAAEEVAAYSSENLTSHTTSNPTGDTQAVITHPRLRLVPNVGLSNRSFVFEVIDRELDPGTVYRIGRFSDRNIVSERLSFKSKVVSRNHAEIWAEQGKVFIRDIGSSSGTFLNRCRLSQPSHISEPYEVKDGDVIQLGVDYQGGAESIYRAVRIRVEINRQIQNPNNPFARTAFQQLRSHLIGTAAPINNASLPASSSDQSVDLGLCREITKVYDSSSTDMISPNSPKQLPLSDLMTRHNHITDMERADIQECCICLYAIAPFQALFIAPCSHIFHFKCLRPIVFQNYPGFSCPLCRNYFDLEASVSVEVDEVLEAISIAKENQKKQNQDHLISPIDTVPELNEDEEGEQVYPNRLNTTAETSLHPCSNHSDQSDNDDVCEEPNQHIKTRLDSNSSSVTNDLTSRVQYLNVDDSNTHSQAIQINDRQPIQAHPRLIRNNEASLSTTLVESPAFRNSPLSVQSDEHIA